MGSDQKTSWSKSKARCVTVFDVLILLNVFAYSALGQVWCMLLIRVYQTCIYANWYILVQGVSQNGRQGRISKERISKVEDLLLA